MNSISHYPQTLLMHTYINQMVQQTNQTIINIYTLPYNLTLQNILLSKNIHKVPILREVMIV